MKIEWKKVSDRAHEWENGHFRAFVDMRDDGSVFVSLRHCEDVIWSEKYLHRSDMSSLRSTIDKEIIGTIKAAEWLEVTKLRDSSHTAFSVEAA